MANRGGGGGSEMAKIRLTLLMHSPYSICSIILNLVRPAALKVESSYVGASKTARDFIFGIQDR